MGKQDYHTIDCPTVTLNTGAKVPVLGLGTWKAEPGEVGHAVKTAIYAGYRHIDCAAAYGNEDEVGKAFQDIFKEGVVTRDQLFVTSKLNNPDHGDVEGACAKTLKDLQLDYLDLYLVHWPVSHIFETPELEPPMTDTWGRMEKLHKEGKCKAIGISNFSVKKTSDLLSFAKVKPAMQQVEIHPYWRNEAIIEFCKQQGIHLTAYSPLGSPDSLVNVGRDSEVPILMDDPAIEKVAKKLGKNKGQVLLRWGIQRGYVVIPKSTNDGRIKSNLEAASFTIPDEDEKALCSLDFQARMLDGASVAKINPKGPYKNLDQLWDGELSDFNRKMERKQAAEKAKAK